jgi:hypothetical protein
VDIRLCDVTVTYVYPQGFFVQAAQAGPAMAFYMGNAWTPNVQVGQTISVNVFDLGNFGGTLQVEASGTPQVVGSAAVADLVQDISAGTLPSEDLESELVKVTGATVTAAAGSNVTISYGTATGVLLRVPGLGELCVGATFDVQAPVTEWVTDSIFRIQAYNMADIANVVTTACSPAAEHDMTNWGFEESTADNPPPDFEKLTADFTAARSTTNFRTGTAGCDLTWTSTSNQDFAQGYYFPVTPTQTVTFGVYAKDNDAAGRVRVGISFYTADKVYVSGDWSSTYTSDPSDWTLMEYSLVAPGTAAFAKGLVRMYDVSANWAGTATVSVDDWSMTATGP